MQYIVFIAITLFITHFNYLKIVIYCYMLRSVNMFMLNEYDDDDDDLLTYLHHLVYGINFPTHFVSPI